MSAFELTTAQQRAVSARGSSLLVSAAAGSGKTHVLTERLIGYVTDAENPADIDRFLVITYTRAAAAELKGRILRRLGEISAAEPENRRLRRQSTLCHNAPIGTIHSFCAKLLRENCHALGLSPDFRVADEDKCLELKSRALQRVLEDYYDNMDARVGFEELVSTIGAGRDDARLQAAVLDLHKKMQCQPYPEKWAQQQIPRLYADGVTDLSETLWGRLLMDAAAETVAYWHDALDEKWQEVLEGGEFNEALINAYDDSIENTLRAQREFLEALKEGWDAAYRLTPIPFERLGAMRNKELTELKDEVAAVRDASKNAMKSISSLFGSSTAKHVLDLLATAESMKALLSLTLDFDSEYAKMKRQRDILDFSDLEHFAVKLLIDEKSGAPTAAAAELSARFEEIMVDEYQDVNAVQELIFNAVSRAGRNIFMVGDVKQSVYRFRLADPTIFIDKLDRYISYTDKYKLNRKIMLQQNFRSERGIIDGCNHIFRILMSRSLGDIDYDLDAQLVARDDAEAGSGHIRFSLLTVPNSDDDESRPDKTAAEARMVARDIRRLIESGTQILDRGERRPVGYGDVAILLLSPGTTGGAFRRALEDEGVPVTARQGGGFFTSPEIMVCAALLQIIDNPHRDVPLTTALTSPLFGFTADELAAIRTADRESDFYSALLMSAQTDEKCRAFIEKLNSLRALSRDVGVHRLICMMYDALDVLPLYSAAGGSQNLLLLAQLAADFEADGYKGLFAFLNYLTRLQQRGEEPGEGAAEGEGAVSILSIHKSKGLEFPVVFLADASHKFNLSDMRQSVLVHPKLGLGCKLTDLTRGIEYPTVARKAIARQLALEDAGEKMRLLYVALTRAREYLFISCAVRDAESFLEKKRAQPPHSEVLRPMSSFAEWLAIAAVNDPLQRIELCLRTESEDKSANAAEAPVPAAPDASALDSLRRSLAFVYPHRGSVNLPTKLTATSLPDSAPDEDATPIAPSHAARFRSPILSKTDTPLSGAEIGTATHIVMQFIDFAKTASPEDIDGEVRRIAALGQLTPRQAQGVDINAIGEFFKSAVGRRILAADVVHRELRFSLLCDAGDFYPEAGEGEKIMLQGVTDCCIEENGALTVIDYKTDRVSAETLPELTERYAPQLRAYALAVSRVLEKPVAGCLLCFLRSGLTAEVSPKN